MNSAAILVVEDERLVARDIADILAQQGYTVPKICASAEAALQQISLTPPDLVLMDIRLAGKMDGIQAAQIIQERFALPVVYLTANADLPTLDRVKASRPFGYMLKPFDELTLITTIDIALSRHRAEQEIRTALQQTETANQQAQAVVHNELEYLAMAAHELRNPLGVIQSVAELLSTPGLKISEEKRERYLQRMQKATASLDDLLQSILTYSYSSVGKLDSELRPIDLVSFCREQIEVLKVSIAPHHQFEFFHQAQKCHVYLDDQLLWHLITNLLSNAIKYSPAAAQTSGQIRLILTWNAQQANLTISDNGIGVPETAVEQIFEPFYRAENAIEIPGTGLGLALAKQCTERQEGKIYLNPTHSENLGGACFTVELPRDNRASQL